MVLGKRLRHTTDDVITPSLLLQRSVLIVPCNCNVAEGGRVPRTRSGERQCKLTPQILTRFKISSTKIACSTVEGADETYRSFANTRHFKQKQQ